MNKLYKSLANIGFVILSLLGLHFFSDYWIHILLAVLAAFLVDFANSHSRKYTSLNGFNTAKEKFRGYKLKRGLDKAIEKEEREEYLKKIIENALEKAQSIDESERKVGLEQLSQFGDNSVYEKMLEILKNGLSKSHEKQIIEALCKILNNTNKW